MFVFSLPVTGADLHIITPVVCVVCIFYTTLVSSFSVVLFLRGKGQVCDQPLCLLQGGLRAVVWTDTLQTVLMVLGVLVVLTLGTVSVGGVGVVFSRAAATNRLEFFK